MKLFTILSAKCAVGQPSEESHQEIFTQEIEMARDRLAAISLSHEYWWFGRVRIDSWGGDLAPLEVQRSGHASSGQEHAPLLFDGWQDKLVAIPSNLPRYKFRSQFVLVEKLSSDSLCNLYVYDREVSHPEKVAKGGLQSNGCIPIGTAADLLNNSLQICYPDRE